jgi:hypothetical protein
MDTAKIEVVRLDVGRVLDRLGPVAPPASVTRSAADVARQLILYGEHVLHFALVAVAP